MGWPCWLGAGAAWLRRWRARWFLPRSLGERGERRAAAYLRRRGLKIVRQRYRTRFGEHDLVAVDGRTVVFVEVKTRRRHDCGRPAEAVDAYRQRRLVRAAAAFLKSHRLRDCPARFDVVEVVWPRDAPPQVRHIPHAFRAAGPLHFGR